MWHAVTCCAVLCSSGGSRAILGRQVRQCLVQAALHGADSWRELQVSVCLILLLESLSMHDAFLSMQEAFWCHKGGTVSKRKQHGQNNPVIRLYNKSGYCWRPNTHAWCCLSMFFRTQALFVRAAGSVVAAAVVVTRMTGGQVQYMEPIEGDFYCSKSCSSFTQQLAVQLVNPLERIKPSALQKALAKPSHKPQQQGVGAQGGGVTTMKSVIEVSWRVCPGDVCASVSGCESRLGSYCLDCCCCGGGATVFTRSHAGLCLCMCGLIPKLTWVLLHSNIHWMLKEPTRSCFVRAYVLHTTNQLC